MIILKKIIITIVFMCFVSFAIMNSKDCSATDAASASAVTDSALKVEEDLKGKSIIYLTFDDGPTSSTTPKVLKILRKYDVKATFFTINYSEENEKYIRKEAEEGHTVAIHGYSHDYKKIYSSRKAFMKNLKKQQKKIFKSTNNKVWIFRFPGGSSNLVSRHYKKGIMKKLVKVTKKAGYIYHDWNVDSRDAGGARNEKDVYRNVVKGLKKKRGNIVLMHDFSGNYKTVNALKKIIKYGKKHGYEFRAITESTPVVHHNVQN
ncbi:MAG: polysaccharide deacetylase [Lachnospiraceae bacterium]|nr:polysaccharide deacetylase [Lachnospiraceae bacterium]